MLVASYVVDTPEKLSEDFELQNWAKELTDPDAGNFTVCDIAILIQWLPLSQCCATLWILFVARFP